MNDKKYEFQLKSGGITYNVYRDCGHFVLDYEDGIPSNMSWPINDNPRNWINIAERHYFKSDTKEPSLTLPIVYRHKIWPEDLRLLIRGSEGKVSVFEENIFSADEWTDEEVIQSIISGMWSIQSVGNVSFGGK